MRLLRLPAALVLLLLAAPAAHAAWGPPIPLSAPAKYSSVLGLAVSSGDRPSVLFKNGYGPLTLRRTGRNGRLGKPVTLVTSRHFIDGGGLFAGRGEDLVGGWLEIVNGSRRPVVATGPRLADRQVLAPGPRSTQFIDLAANRRGDAVVAFWRYTTELQYTVHAAYRRAGGRFGPAQLLATGVVGDPAAAIDEHGAAAVSWTEKPGVSVAERPAGAAAFGAPVNIPAAEQANGDVGVAIENGRVLVSWAIEPSRGPNAVLVAERASAGEPFAAPVPISVPGITAPRQTIAVSLRSGRALVAWTQRRAGINRAALAIKPPGGEWQAPIVRAAGVTIRRVGLLGSAGARPPLLWMTTDHRGLQTGTIRDDGTLAPSRRLDVGHGPAAFPYLAQGRSRSWVEVSRYLGTTRNPRSQPVLFGSTP